MQVSFRVTSVQVWGWYLVLLVICAVLLPQLTSWGMFEDGVTYATISRNLSIGLGTWWSPFFTATVHPQFHEQPPLAIILQSLFFTVAGDHYLVEKTYSFLTMLGTLWLVWRTWTRMAAILENAHLKAHAWLPILLWVSIPKWNWAYKSNVLENTMGFFCVLSFYFVLRAISNHNGIRATMFSVLAAFSLVCAGLTKGPAGLFPLVSPVIMAMVLGRPLIARGVLVTLVIVASLTLSAILTASYEPLRINLENYSNQHLFPAISGERSTEHSLSAMFRALVENLLPMMIVLLAWIVRLRMTHTLLHCNRRFLMAALGFLLVGLCGSVPLAVSHTFRSFYLTPSFPFFALGFAALIACLAPRTADKDGWASASASRPVSAVTMLAMIGLLAGVLTWSLSRIGTPRKDKRFYEQLHSLEHVIQRNTIIGGDASISTKWSYHALLHRYLLVSLDTGKSALSRTFYLAPSGQPPPPDFESTGLSFGNCFLLKRHSQAQPRGSL
jgi:hypothetical protein